MKWFGRKSAGREQSRPALARGFGAAITGDWPRHYEGQLREAFLQNAIAQRAVRLVAEGVASVVPLTLDMQDSTQGDTIIRLIRATQAGQHLLETLATHLLLHGNAYVQISQTPDGQPAGLYALRPERVTITPDSRGWPAAYRYKVGDVTTQLAVRDGRDMPEIVHIRTTHPADDHFGLGCLGAAAGAMAIHNAAQRWNKALLDNAARPSGALVYDPGEAGGTLSPEQFERLRSEMEASFAGAGNAGRPMLLEGGLTWQAMSLSPADMDFVGLKASAAREIALAFGVPPLILGLPGDNSYANYAEANRAVWRQTILPMADRILAALGEALAAWWPGLRLEADRDDIPALAEERATLWAQLSAADFITQAEKRVMLGFPPQAEADAQEKH